MKKILILLLCLSMGGLFGQEDFLAKRYYEDGEFEKAVVFYEKLVSEDPRRTDYSEKLISCYQQLQEYDKAISYLKARIESGMAYPTLLIDMGYTYRLQQQPETAEIWYEEALGTIEQNPNFGYGIGFKFQRYTLLEYALKAYKRAMELNPDLDFNFQIARIYGEQGRIEEMFEAYMVQLEQRPAAKSNIYRVLEGFVSTDALAENNQLLRKILLTRAQRKPDPVWNELLSWLFIQQEQYASALNQEKAIYRRSEGKGLERIINLGRLAEDARDLAAARAAFEYIRKESSDPVSRLNAELHLIDIGLLEDPSGFLPSAEKAYEDLMENYGYQGNTLQLQVSFANFLTFRLGEAERAVAILKKSLELPVSNYTEGYLKLNLGDILVFSRRFNEALILFSQVQKLLKNDVMGQQARYKVAQTSFYKGDFDWALTQLKVLRNSTSQLIANDAMQLSLLISDNSVEDSTRTALKKFAWADLLAYQQKNEEALESLEELLQQHKGEKIEDDALLMQAELLTAKGEFSKAALSYRKIIEFYGQGILADDAHFGLAELYRTKLEEPAKAMEHYQQIIFQYQDSYFFPDARKKFRQLRGDPVN
ncbi:tetratricopeptide repeat protein [Robiginitalea sp. IMCC44478]|uniref:tetratricopeptide repeat protein n=1 Tax=Robiginitalea sp. IMCC44478 TaxID=3459122 RepID=UPI0040426767